MKFILDIDGVLVHANPHRQVEMDTDGFYKFNPLAVKALNAVMNREGDDELILSTSHRFRFSINQWRDIFQNRGIYINNISIIDLPLQYNHSRRSEIVKWIDSHQLRTEDIVIIDDDKSLNELPSYLKERLVLTNSYIGLDNSRDLEKITKRRKLRGGARSKKTS
jgi:hypothetical protein